jgi:hypothetical protein
VIKVQHTKSFIDRSFDYMDDKERLKRGLYLAPPFHDTIDRSHVPSSFVLQVAQLNLPAPGGSSLRPCPKSAKSIGTGSQPLHTGTQAPQISNAAPLSESHSSVSPGALWPLAHLALNGRHSSGSPSLARAFQARLGLMSPARGFGKTRQAGRRAGAGALPHASGPRPAT